MVSFYITAKITSLNSKFIKIITSSWYSNVPYLLHIFNVLVQSRADLLFPFTPSLHCILILYTVLCAWWSRHINVCCTTGQDRHLPVVNFLNCTLYNYHIFSTLF
jgi:hypothetical protein